ncbi:AI-2E family transporter [Planomonospora corallina]|uniref:AI-2E family transporter n=1 Tax=Planomonospora corallina TaxID=1806052 RepID=A0ABV8IDY2_9ACTN
MSEHSRPPDPSGWRATPGALRTAAVAGACLLVLTAVVALVAWLLILLAPLTLAVVAALLLTALLGPVAALLRRLRAPAWLSALGTVLFLLFVVAGPLTLVANQAIAQLGDLENQLLTGLERLRGLLTSGPLSQKQLDAAIAEITQSLQRAAPSPLAGAMTALQTLASIVVALVLLFFLLRDGAGMWRWIVGQVPGHRRRQVDVSARAGWETLVSYIRGIVVVAAIDAVGIGVALLVLDVPLALTLAFLTFLFAFIPIAGAFMAGAVAVLVALVSNGLTNALLVLAAVVIVQQVEGNFLEPFIIGRALRLHPAVVLVAVTGGTLVGGIAGAVVAVPLVAVTYRIADRARAYSEEERARPVPAGGRPGPAPGGGGPGPAPPAAAEG